jgi:lipoprotein-anchoring transpeptidase ErfK/SrfK
MRNYKIIISLSEQTARVLDGEKQIKIYSISSAQNGPGCEVGSNKTPTGKLRIHKKIGGDMAHGTVFKGRVPTGDVCGGRSSEDLILSRILWLEGLEPSNSNTLERYIYLHGTNHEYLIGQPKSHGCIRLKNNDIIELYDLIDEGTDVFIE